MTNRNLPDDLESIEAHMRRARLERSAALAKMLADGAEALSCGVRRAVASVLKRFGIVHHAGVQAPKCAGVAIQ